MEELLLLNKLHSILTCEKEKKLIKSLIIKRDLPFLIDFKIVPNEKDLSYARNFINKTFNKKLVELIPEIENYPFKIREDLSYRHYNKKHWLNFNKTYKELTMIRFQIQIKEKSKIKNESLKLLNIYTEEQIELIIKNHFKL